MIHTFPGEGALEGLPSLKIASLSNNPIEEVVWDPEKKEEQKLEKLETLYMTRSQMRLEQVAKLSDDNLPKLREVDFRKTPISEEHGHNTSLEVIIFLKKMAVINQKVVTNELRSKAITVNKERAEEAKRKAEEDAKKGEDDDNQ